MWLVAPVGSHLYWAAFLRIISPYLSVSVHIVITFRNPEGSIFASRKYAFSFDSIQQNPRLRCISAQTGPYPSFWMGTNREDCQQLEGSTGSLLPIAKLQPLASAWALGTLSEWQR